MSAELAMKVNRVRRQLFDSGPAIERSKGDFQRVALPLEETDILRRVVEHSGAKSALEIGLAYGASALSIGEALGMASDDAHHTIIDAFQDQYSNVGWNILCDAGLEHQTTLIGEKSQTALPRLLLDGYRTSFAFIDGSHIFHNVFLDLVFVDQIVEGGGLVVLDDCQYPSVSKAVRYFILNRGWVLLDVVPTGSRLSAFRVPTSPVVATFEDFQDF